LPADVIITFQNPSVKHSLPLLKTLTLKNEKNFSVNVNGNIFLLILSPNSSKSNFYDSWFIKGIWHETVWLITGNCANLVGLKAEVLVEQRSR
jgi:hypothetical protein